MSQALPDADTLYYIRNVDSNLYLKVISTGEVMLGPGKIPDSFNLWIFSQEGASNTFQIFNLTHRRPVTLEKAITKGKYLHLTPMSAANADEPWIIEESLQSNEPGAVTLFYTKFSGFLYSYTKSWPLVVTKENVGQDLVKTYWVLERFDGV
ncbi:hypothetical protein CPB83DRAFT_909921 [Crepidotus variabilis]|uniref:Uncharacterized protein n=1 Tax=Crepidotus variabilis TaxID=179855 RepID=A0A9P6E8I7_9AGAR|nr:hypothetical protein CPB83DRAFT_909921 [Crepidotus variabilis]